MVCKILQISYSTYNMYIDDANSNMNLNGNDEVGDLFLDIESMLLSDRISSAENKIKDGSSIDRTNRYKKQMVGLALRLKKILQEMAKKKS